MERMEDRLLAPLPPINPGDNIAAWRERRKEILTEIVDLEYGGFPPESESAETSALKKSCAALHTGSAQSFATISDATVSFRLTSTS